MQHQIPNPFSMPDMASTNMAGGQPSTNASNTVDMGEHRHGSGAIFAWPYAERSWDLP